MMATPGTRRLVALKLAAEMVLLHPVSLVAFFGAQRVESAVLVVWCLCSLS